MIRATLIRSRTVIRATLIRSRTVIRTIVRRWRAHAQGLLVAVSRVLAGMRAYHGYPLPHEFITSYASMHLQTAMMHRTIVHWSTITLKLYARQPSPYPAAMSMICAKCLQACAAL